MTSSELEGLALDILFKYYFRTPPDVTIPLGKEVQPGSIHSVVYLKPLWIKESLYIKIMTVLKRKYKPKDQTLLLAAQEVLMHDIFGELDDYAAELINLNAWHNSRIWDMQFLTSVDDEKAAALSATMIATRTKLRSPKFPNLHLRMAVALPFICFLVHPMVAKVPVISIEHYVEIHHAFCYNSIRKARHPYADQLISYIYELSFIQQKIATSFHAFYCDYCELNTSRTTNWLAKSEIDVIKNLDLAITYLKSSIEKVVVIVGLTHEISSISDKKEHKQRIAALMKGIPAEATKAFYWELILEFISANNLEKLNNYRTGLVHKKGVSQLQPHNFVGMPGSARAYFEVFNDLHFQHVKNSAVILSAFAMLTDKLMVLDPANATSDNFPADLAHEAMLKLGSTFSKTGEGTSLNGTRHSDQDV